MVRNISKAREYDGGMLDRKQLYRNHSGHDIGFELERHTFMLWWQKEQKLSQDNMSNKRKTKLARVNTEQNPSLRFILNSLGNFYLSLAPQIYIIPKENS